MKATSTIDNGEDHSTLRVAGELTVQAAEEFQAQLSELIQLNSPHLEISLSEITAVDVSAMQLIQASRTAAFEAGKTFSVTGPDEEGVRSLITRTGFTKLLNITTT